MSSRADPVACVADEPASSLAVLANVGGAGQLRQPVEKPGARDLVGPEPEDPVRRADAVEPRDVAVGRQDLGHAIAPVAHSAQLGRACRGGVGSDHDDDLVGDRPEKVQRLDHPLGPVDGERADGKRIEPAGAQGKSLTDIRALARHPSAS